MRSDSRLQPRCLSSPIETRPRGSTRAAAKARADKEAGSTRRTASRCSTSPCVVAELTRQAERQGLTVDSLLPRELFEVSADLGKVLDLTDSKTLDALGISPPDLVRDDHRFTQEIGEAAHEHAFQAILSPSATGVDHVLAIFPEKLAGAVLDVRRVGEWTTPDDLATRAR